jgi:hypothetical protein
MSDLGPFLHPNVRRLIEADRNAPDPPDAVKRAVAERVDRSLGLGGAMLALTPGLGLNPPPSIDPSTPSIPPPPASLFGWKAVAGTTLAVVAGGIAALSFAMRSPLATPSRAEERPVAVQESPVAVVAGGAGALSPSNVARQAPSMARGVAPDQLAPAGPASRVSRTRAADSGAARTAPRHRAVPSRAPAVDTLAAERTVLDGARAAIVRRDGSGALAALRSHEQSFPRGQLLEERESMRVQALALSHDPAVRAAADRFRRHFPRSMFLPAVEQAVDPTP